MQRFAKTMALMKPVLDLWILLGMVSFLHISGALAGPPGSGMGPPPLVEVEVVSSREVSAVEEYVGHVEAVEKVDLRARVEGFIEQMKFKEGDFVKKGQILYVIERAPYEAKVSEAEAKVAQARANLDRAQKRLKRLRSARPESVPATQMDSAIADESSARAQLMAALAELNLSRINLSYTVIRAPIAGRIGKSAYTRGNLVNSSSGPLATVVKIDPIRVLYWVSEREISGLLATLRKNVGKAESDPIKVRLRLADGREYPFSGKMDFIDNKVDPSTGTIAVRAIFPNKEGILVPGQYVTVLVAKKASQRVPVVPQRAVMEDRKGSYVLVINQENKVSVRRVKTGTIIDGAWAIEQGLSPGERIIVEGVHKVRPGQVVKPISSDKPRGSGK